MADSEFKNAIKDLTAGTMAGMTSKIIEYPFDTIKVRQQTQHFSGPAEVFRSIIKTDGFKGLYRGLTAPLCGAMAENAIIFLIYSRTKRELEKLESGHPRPTLNASIAGFASGAGVAFWLTPVELIKVRLQAESTRHIYRGPIDCAVKIFREQGLRSFFKGHSTTLARETVGGAAYFGVYETVCQAFIPAGRSRADLHPLYMLLAGAAAGASYWTVIFPADTVKSRIQAERSLGTSVVDVIKQIHKSHGLKGFYAGLSVTLARALPSNACILGTYELMMRWLAPL